jgi:hypothetical protein
MGETVHIIPVGFDYERLLHPISKEDLPADRITLLHSSPTDGDEAAYELASSMVEQLEYTLSHFDTEATIERVEDIYDYPEMYTLAYRLIENEVADTNDVWVNISSMPRTVAFAFATAANVLTVENPEWRDDIHTYYVSPDQYYAINLLKELRKERSFLEALSEMYSDDRIEERLESVDELLSKVERSGLTKGAKQMHDGNHYVEFPATPLPNLNDFEVRILRFLSGHGPTQSTSELGRRLSDHDEQNSDSGISESFRSKVQYNVTKLETKGYVERDESAGGFETRLSTMGKLWVDTHQ